MNRRPSPLDNEQCRQCSSFSDYVKVTQKNKGKIANDGSTDNHTKETEKTELEKPSRTDCPLDKDELGRSSWGLLHTMAAKYPENPSRKEQKDMKEFFRIFSNFYPCEHCAKDFQDDLKQDPPKVESHEALAQWLCRMHNKVNVKINKEQFNCERVNERWRDGWLDGSCDF